MDRHSTPRKPFGGGRMLPARIILGTLVTSYFLAGSWSVTSWVQLPLRTHQRRPASAPGVITTSTAAQQLHKSSSTQAGLMSLGRTSKRADAAPGRGSQPLLGYRNFQHGRSSSGGRMTLLHAAGVDTNDDFQNMGLNELQTLLRESVKAERYMEAARLRDVIANKMSSSGEPSDVEGGQRGVAVEDESASSSETSSGTTRSDGRKLKRLSWLGLGTAPWLVERLEALGFNLPTTIQISAMESVNAMLLEDEEVDATGDVIPTLEELMEQQKLRSLPSSEEDHDDADNINMAVIVSGSTGSGKTLAYAVPLLSTLSESLFRRQRIRVKAEEDISDAADDLLSRVAVTTSPEVRGKGPNDTVGGKAATLGKSGSDVTKPLALIVVPTRELGVQTALNVYELVGGSVRRTATDFRPGAKSNMFKYKGPRGVKIGCILDDSEAETGLKLQTDIAITTPQYLTKLLDEGDVDPTKLRVIVFDEADLAVENTQKEDLQRLFHTQSKRDGSSDDDDDDDEEDFDDEPWLRRTSRLTYMVGASVTEALRDVEGSVVEDGSILPRERTYLATATSFGPLSFDDDDDDTNSGKEKKVASSLKQLHLQLDPGLVHERVVAPNDTGLLCLCRMLRRELQESSEDGSSSEGGIVRGADRKRAPQRPRVVIFFPTEEEARKSMHRLRDAMWGDYRLGVLLPTTGVNPLSIMEDFKANKTSVLLATPNSVRGLDFPDLTHVYTLYLPADEPREYVHLAGRVGRLGQRGSVSGRGGRVTSILRPGESEKMEDMAKALNFDFVDVDYAEAAPGVNLSTKALQEDEEGYILDDEDDGEEMDVEGMRRYLEDVVTLMGDDDDLPGGLLPGGIVDVEYEDIMSDDDDDDDDDVPSATNSGCDI